MRTNTRRIFGLGAILCALFAHERAFSQVESYNESVPFPILFQGFGPRAVGMGNSFTAVADDASALFYNPAGLAELENPEFLTAFNNRVPKNFAGTLGYVHPFAGFGTMGFNFQYINYGNVQGPFEAQDFALSAAFAFSPAPGMDFGVREQWFKQSVYGDRQGMAVDFGFLASPWDRIYFGLDLKNLGFETGTAPLPLQLLSGISMRLGRETGEKHSLTASFGGSLVFPDSLRMNAGLEFGLFKRFFLRAGTDLRVAPFLTDFPEGFAIGTGILLGNFRLDGSLFSLGTRGDIIQIALTWFLPPAERASKSEIRPSQGSENTPAASKESAGANPLVLNFEVTEPNGLSRDQLFEMGLDKEKLGLTGEAVDLYLKAVELDPDFERGWSRLGLLYLEQSRDSYRKVLRLDPSNEKTRKLLERLSP